eukprot:Em0006g1281a
MAYLGFGSSQLPGVDQATSSIYITSLLNGFVLEISGGGYDNGAVVLTAPKNASSPNCQLWFREYQPDGSLLPERVARCLYGGNDQRWRYEGKQLVSAATNLTLQVSDGSGTPYFPLIMWECVRPTPLSQEFALEECGDSSWAAPQVQFAGSYPPQQPSFPPQQPSFLPEQPSFPPQQPSFPPQQPSFPPQQPSFLPEQPSFPPQQPSFPPQQPSFLPEQPSFLPEQPSFPPQQPSFPPQQPSFPPQQPSFLPEQLSFPPQQPSFPPQQPSFPPQQPSFPPQQPSFSPQQPSFPPQQPSFPPQQPSFSPQQPSFPPQQPSFPPPLSPQQPSFPPQQPSSLPQQPPPSPQQLHTSSQQPPQHTSPPSTGAALVQTPSSPGSQEEIKEGTVKAIAQFDPEADSKILHTAMKGLFKDEGSVIRVLTHRSNQQRQQLKLKFKVLFGKDLSHELHSAFSGNFGKVVDGLMMTPVEFDAFCLFQGIEGLGTDEKVLIEILCTRTNQEIKAIKQQYKTMFSRDLERDVVGDTSGDFKRLLVSMLAGFRDESSQVDEAKARADAERLYQAGEARWGTDESVFNQILASRSFPQLRATFQAYAKLSKYDMEHVIEKEMSGHLKEGMLAIVKSVKNKTSFFAEKLYKSMKGAGTDDKTLVRVVVTRSEVDMVNIRKAFKQLYGKTLGSSLREIHQVTMRRYSLP